MAKKNKKESNKGKKNLLIAFHCESELFRLWVVRQWCWAKITGLDSKARVQKFLAKWWSFVKQQNVKKFQKKVDKRQVNVLKTYSQRRNRSTSPVCKNKGTFIWGFVPQWDFQPLPSFQKFIQEFKASKTPTIVSRPPSLWNEFMAKLSLPFFLSVDTKKREKLELINAF